jgi:tRNA wybutosine-synthesizing protein 3
MAESRFEMIKKHNWDEFEKAIAEGKADKRIIPLCSFINSLPDFFSSSSCAGRIMLLKTDAKETKREAAFHAKWHRTVKLHELASEIDKKVDAPELWLKQEPFILHLGTNSLANANKLLQSCRLAGVKRAGIMVAEEEKFIVELIGTQNLSMPVKFKEKVLVGKKFLGQVLEKANAKLKRNYALLKKFEKILKQELGGCQKAVVPIEQLFGTAKFKKSGQQIKDEMRKGWE